MMSARLLMQLEISLPVRAYAKNEAVKVLVLIVLINVKLTIYVLLNITLLLTFILKCLRKLE